MCIHICGDAGPLRFLVCVPVQEKYERQGVKLETFVEWRVWSVCLCMYIEASIGGGICNETVLP